MGEVFNYDDRVFDVIAKNKKLMIMKDMINNILKSAEIKKILEKASKGGFELDEDDKDFSKMLVDNNYEINTILDAYMQEMSDLATKTSGALASAYSSISKDEHGLVDKASKVNPRSNEKLGASATLEEPYLQSEILGTDSARDFQTGLVTGAVRKVEESAKEENVRASFRAQNVRERAQDLLPGGEQRKRLTVEGEKGQEEELLEEVEEVEAEPAGTISASTTGTGGDYEQGGITKPQLTAKGLKAQVGEGSVPEEQQAVPPEGQYPKSPEEKKNDGG
jgi:hypothetical protein